ncbi:MAG: hypothetical protein Q8O92_06705 [Candidatus Latescibacter sp.]|nr:hypothetical protein [Candidatus Latescibacter sp.]
MKKVLIVLSFLGLALTVIPAFFVFYGAVSWNTHANLMFAGMVMWFVTAPFWMGKKN